MGRWNTSQHLDGRRGYIIIQSTLMHNTPPHRKGRGGRGRGGSVCVHMYAHTLFYLLRAPPSSHTTYPRRKKRKSNNGGKQVLEREKKVTDGGGFQWQKALEINGRSGAARQHLKRYNPKSNSENPFLLLFRLMCENECIGGHSS